MTIGHVGASRSVFVEPRDSLVGLVGPYGSEGAKAGGRARERALSGTNTMKRKMGDVSRKRRLRGDTRALWYAAQRTSRFSRRILMADLPERKKAVVDSAIA